MTDYKVKFDVFEGPLDLLLYLIKKEEVDIYDVNLTQLATQFIEYIELMRMLDLEIASAAHISDFDEDAWHTRPIVTARHCLGCTAGAGSSCGGQTA